MSLSAPRAIVIGRCGWLCGMLGDAAHYSVCTWTGFEYDDKEAGLTNKLFWDGVSRELHRHCKVS